MKHLAAVLAILLAVSPLAAQDRPIDLPRRAPVPAVALSRSLIIPGAGWFYLSATSAGKPGDKFSGLAHLLMTAGGVALIVSGTRQHKRGLVGFGVGMTFASRFLDIWGVTDAAANRRDGVPAK